MEMYTVGIWGYSFASIAYVLFSLLILAAHNKSSIAKWLLFSALMAATANIIGALQVSLGFSLQWAMLADAIKIAAFSVFILSFNIEKGNVKDVLHNETVRKYLLFWFGSSIVCWGLSYTLDYSYEYLFLLFVILNLLSLVLLEQIYRGANDEAKESVTPLVLALGGIAVFDFVLFAQATMVGGIEFQFWYIRGYLSALAVPLLLVSVRRFKAGTVRVFVSRNVVFYSSMLMIAGLYLLAMAVAGYLINYFGGKWGELVSFGFFILGSIVLAVLLITESVRRRVKVFISKHFFANKYEYREEWLELIEKIETATAENYYQMSLQIMMSKVDATGGVILKAMENNRFVVPHSDGIELDESFDKDLELLENFTKRQGWIIDINEYSENPLSYPGLFIQPKIWHAVGVNILVPILIGKTFYGFFVLSNSNEENKLNWEDRDLLFAISKQLGNFISLNEANDKLAEAKQFDAFNQMSAFLVHDLKNIQAQLALITSNAIQHRDNPEFVDDVFETVESATERLAKVLTQLRNKQVAQSTSRKVDLGDIIERVIEQRNVIQPRVYLQKIDNCLATLDDERFFSVMNHLIQNAQEASAADGRVDVILEKQGERINIAVSDNGCGMSATFIKTRLFKPFDTTKGNAGMGIGVFDAKQFFESVAGSLTVESIEGQGTKMMISLPI
ncbi:PEP-CTERM system histidine kinase PrsK [Colwellia sp. 4_MG-2023]|uniref:XrtA/PEP-CTERM system histidine kinase PrsK n=1 Tax=unclassified Colwellia TaxID=196834 RepID=UPI0020904AEE|nr:MULTISPECIES: XrtA/PEP-CTERM system histidine kinase PrsK [unclassified Colwellia]MDO6506854.1 PEP-CTERM system histidine kinase PrsK [Colwellia sp. 5_MG-2023]MDO6555771.1 PEP-CTERM system histidine kinase PrsK [Colwellia sp. 4_MG-2023]MDO6652812.1 PEP-CTERM system histidine kinase PrsK [Colwellia sp. 3_MG-2023]MDO6665815.1 PEP-CTERM system histidine kinase PrsK [Colwellia sp. 2_MG-2023]MDO6690188.1 PEP-CTERM system histidine kinase PrsK [Colwellia sp. 1_MG-2023]